MPERINPMKLVGTTLIGEDGTKYLVIGFMATMYENGVELKTPRESFELAEAEVSGE